MWLGWSFTDLDRDEVSPALVGQSLGEKRLAASGGAEKQHTCVVRWVGRCGDGVYGNVV